MFLFCWLCDGGCVCDDANGGYRMDLRDGIFAHPGWAEALNNLWGGERREIGGGE